MEHVWSKIENINKMYRYINNKKIKINFSELKGYLN